MQIGFLPLLFLIFLVLKLTHVIAWAWWIVFLPLYIGIAVFVAAVLVFAILAFIRQL